MDAKNLSGSVGLLGSALAGPVVALLAYALFREPCPSAHGLPPGVPKPECVWGMTVPAFATTAGGVCFLLALFLAFVFGSE